jgi:hypothetical protein
MRSFSGLLAGLLVAVAIPVAAQQPTLGELAKKEQERRKASAPAAKTFTNDDLKKISLPPEGAKPAETKPADAAKPADASKPDDTAKPGDASKPDSTTDPAKDEKYWRGRMDAAREEIRRNEAFRDALQSRINGLSADFAARDDPYQRAKIGEDRQKALAELARVNNEIEKGNKLIATIEDEARRAGVPPGWIR